MDKLTLSRVANWQSIEDFKPITALRHIDSFARQAKEIAGGADFGLGVEEPNTFGKPAASFVELYVYFPDESASTTGVNGVRQTEHAAVMFAFSLYAPVVAVAAASFTTMENGGTSSEPLRLSNLKDAAFLNSRPAYKALALALQNTPFSVKPPAFFSELCPDGVRPLHESCGEPPSDKIFDVFFQIDFSRARI